MGKDSLGMFSQFSKVSQKLFHECKRLSLIILNNKHFWPRECESTSMKASIGLKLRIFSPANLSMSIVAISYNCKLMMDPYNFLCSIKSFTFTYICI